MANQKNGNKKSKRDDFESRKVSNSKQNKTPRKQLILAKIAATNPGQLTATFDYKPKHQVPAIQKEYTLTGTPAEMADVIYTGEHDGEKYIGLIQLDDVTYRMGTRDVHGNDVQIVYVHNAKSGPLAKASGSDTFMLISQLTAKNFGTPLKSGTDGYGIQINMYTLLRGIFYREGILNMVEKKPETKPAEAKNLDTRQLAYEKAQTAAIPKFMDGVHGVYNLFGVILSLGVHPKHKTGTFLSLVRSGSELGKLKSMPRISFKNFVFGTPETDYLPENEYKADMVKFLSFLRGKLAKEIAFKLAERDGLMQKDPSPKSVEPEQLGIAVASQFESLPPGGEITGGRNVYGRCHGSHSVHQKV